MRMKISDSNWQRMVNSNISTMLITAVQRKVSRTRSGLRAPKFWPAIGAEAKATAMAGSMMMRITPCATPNPACAAAPKSRISQ